MSAPWVRDFSLVGGVTGFVAPYVVIHDLEYSAAAGAGGAVTGALLGLFTARLLAGSARRWRKFVFIPAGLVLGAVWGMGAALATAVTESRNLLLLSLLFAGAAGAVQLGWFWLAYCYRRVNARSTFAVVALACVLAGGLGWTGFGALAVVRAVLS